MSLYTAEQITSILNGAPAVDPNVIWRQMGGASYFGDVADATYANMWYTYENAPNLYRELYLDPYLDAWQAGGGKVVTPSATEVLVPQAAVNAETGAVEGTIATRMPATTTPAGNVKAGALAGRLPIGTAIAGVAIGAGIGIKEVATHPEFWNDLSEAVFNDLKNPDAYIAKPFAYDETMNVIWRCLQDGGIQGYCDKRDVDLIVKNLYEMNAFNAVDRIDPNVTQPGVQNVTIGTLDQGVAVVACNNTGLAPQAHVIPTMFDSALARFPGATTVYADVLHYPAGTGYITMKFYNLQDGGSYRVVGSAQDGFAITDIRSNFVGSVSASIDVDGSIYGNISYRTTSIDADNQVLIGVRPYDPGQGASGCNATNAGAVVIPKNPNVIYNGEDQLPPDDPTAFWTTFADWLANSFSVTAYNPLTNANETTTYVPFTAPENNWKIQDITGSQQNVWEGLYDFVEPFLNPSTTPVNNPSPWIFESIGNYISPDPKIPEPTPWDNNPKFPTGTPTPNGNSPEILAPTSGVSSGSKLYSVYNPSQANLDALGSYLWTENIIDKIEQFFKNSPLEAIISLHMVYCTPTTGTAKNIYLGYLDSGVSAATVTSQYEDIACGYVDIPEMYGNVLDYKGVTVQVFLPFIGFKVLKTKEVMGKRLEIDYKVDVYTGVCLAMLYVVSANTRQLLYTYEGNCSVQIPLTSSDRTRIISGLITAGVSAFTGNPAGVVGGIASMGINIERSGGFSGNAGAMGVKKPYVVISRAIDAQASHYNTMYGYPINKYGYLQNFRGYTRVQSVHVDIPDATSEEIIEIESLLKEGIII